MSHEYFYKFQFLIGQLKTGKKQAQMSTYTNSFQGKIPHHLFKIITEKLGDL